MIDNECYSELTKINKNDKILSKDLEVSENCKNKNSQKDLEVSEKFSKKDKNYEDHACYELHLGYMVLTTKKRW